MRRAVVLLVLSLSACHRSAEATHVRASEEAIVNKALDIYGHGKVSREELRRSYDINVVHLSTMTCVGFNLRPGTAGGDDTMCFDRSDNLVLTYTNGD